MNLQEIFKKQTELYEQKFLGQEDRPEQKFFYLEMTERMTKTDVDLLGNLTEETDPMQEIPEIDLWMRSCKKEELENALKDMYFCGYRIEYPQFTKDPVVTERERKYLRQEI